MVMSQLLRLERWWAGPTSGCPAVPARALLQVSTADVHEYKSTTRAHIKRVTADIEKDWGGGNVGSEWLILYVRPFELEAGDRGAK